MTSKCNDNIPSNEKKKVPGYPSLAGKMGLEPQHSVLRSFSALGMQNLFYYQAELVYLEDRLRKVEAWSSAQGDGTKQYQFARDWDELKRSWRANIWKEEGSGTDRSNLSSYSGSTQCSAFEDIPSYTDDEQLRLVLRLRATLKQYCTLFSSSKPFRKSRY